MRRHFDKRGEGLHRSMNTILIVESLKKESIIINAFLCWNDRFYIGIIDILVKCEERKPIYFILLLYIRNTDFTTQTHKGRTHITT